VAAAGRACLPLFTSLASSAQQARLVIPPVHVVGRRPAASQQQQQQQHAGRARHQPAAKPVSVMAARAGPLAGGPASGLLAAAGPAN